MSIFAWNSAQYVEAERNKYFKRKKGRNFMYLRPFFLLKVNTSLKDNNINHVITWQIIAHAKPYNSASKRCNLCLIKKFIIICEPHRCTLNKRNEPVSGCRHRKKSLQRSN